MFTKKILSPYVLRNLLFHMPPSSDPHSALVCRDWNSCVFDEYHTSTFAHFRLFIAEQVTTQISQALNQLNQLKSPSLTDVISYRDSDFYGDMLMCLFLLVTTFIFLLSKPYDPDDRLAFVMLRFVGPLLSSGSLLWYAPNATSWAKEIVADDPSFRARQQQQFQEIQQQFVDSSRVVTTAPVPTVLVHRTLDKFCNEITELPKQLNALALNSRFSEYDKPVNFSALRHTKFHKYVVDSAGEWNSRESVSGPTSKWFACK